MVEVATKSGIVIREIVDEKTINKVDTRPLEKALEVIDLSKYGTGIKKILFIVVALPPGGVIHKDEVVYDRRKRKLTLELNLNYPHILAASASEVTSMTAKLFLNSTNLYSQVEICDFDIKTYKSYLIKTFTFNGWLP